MSKKLSDIIDDRISSMEAKNKKLRESLNSVVPKSDFAKEFLEKTILDLESFEAELAEERKKLNVMRNIEKMESENTDEIRELEEIKALIERM